MHPVNIRKKKFLGLENSQDRNVSRIVMVWAERKYLMVFPGTMEGVDKNTDHEC